MFERIDPVPMDGGTHRTGNSRGVGVVFSQLRQLSRQIKLQRFSDYTKRYQFSADKTHWFKILADLAG